MMKKIAVLVCTIFSLLFLCGCYGSELVISIGDGSVPDDGVSIQLKYNDVWKNGDAIFAVNYGHESAAVLADEYYLAFSDADPLFSDNINLTQIYSFTKSDLESRTVNNGKFSGESGEIVIDDLSSCLPKQDGTCTVYLVFYSSDTDFSSIITFSRHEFNYEWQQDGVKLV